MREDINKYVDDYFDEMIERLKDLIRIDSQKKEAKDGMPFGEGAYKVLKYAESMLNDYGFVTTNYDNYVLTADIDDKKGGLDILAHLDVVTEGEGWTVCEPFEPVIKDGNIYGRGSADDKGPAIAAILAMRAVKDLGYQLKKGVRLILGTDEECGSEDLLYYYSKEKEAQMSFTPDAEFPVINTEKGRLRSPFVTDIKIEKNSKSVIEIKAGKIINVVPSKARAKVANISKAEVEDTFKSVLNDSRLSCVVKDLGDATEIYIEGIGGHSAYPEVSCNALTAMLRLLSSLDLDDNHSNNLIKEISKYFDFGDYYGKALGIDMEDEISGKTTICLNVCDFGNDKFSASFDCRAALPANDENLTKVITQKLSALGFKVEEDKMVPSHHVSADSFLVKTLLEVYEDHFGKKGTANSTGGGTYVHDLKNGVAFGCEVEGVDNHLHGSDEFMVVDMIRKSAKIFADAIIRLCVECE